MIMNKKSETCKPLFKDLATRMASVEFKIRKTIMNYTIELQVFSFLPLISQLKTLWQKEKFIYFSKNILITHYFLLYILKIGIKVASI